MTDFGPPYTDVRIEPPMCHTVADLKRIFPASLMQVNMHPPASGPEIELVFGTPEGAEPCAEDLVVAAVQSGLGTQVLASRTRGEDS